MNENVKQVVSKNLNILSDQQGFENGLDFLTSFIHIPQMKILLVTSTLTTVGASFFEKYFGIQLIIFLGILVLFIMEMFTGILHARRNGVYSSKKAPRGVIKMCVYFTFLGCVNIFAANMDTVQIPNSVIDVNIYKIFYYFLLNFTILNLIISNIENFEKLGWDEYVPLIKKLHSFLKLKKTTKTKDE
jgi:hypothetical protein